MSSSDLDRYKDGVVKARLSGAVFKCKLIPNISSVTHWLKNALASHSVFLFAVVLRSNIKLQSGNDVAWISKVARFCSVCAHAYSDNKAKVPVGPNAASGGWSCRRATVDAHTIVYKITWTQPNSSRLIAHQHIFINQQVVRRNCTQWTCIAS